MSRTITYYIRNLPHWHPPETDLFITWRLFGSLPRQTPPPKATSSPGAAFVHYDHILDVARTGPLWLKDPRIAESILASLKNGHDRKLFNLRAYAVMANHIHVLLMPIAPLAKLTQLVKGATARQANLILSRTGTRFWQDESFDHWVRDPAEGQKIRSYIERNPVAAGFVARPEDWPWSSASHPIE
ncbi:MAG: transposase [Candidatus Acidiferrales bacterium]